MIMNEIQKVPDRELQFSYDPFAEFNDWMNDLRAAAHSRESGPGRVNPAEDDETGDEDASYFAGGMSLREDRVRDRNEESP